MSTAMVLAALALTVAGAACLYLGAPRQQWLAHPLPGARSRLAGGGLLLSGWLCWRATLEPATAFFTMTTLVMALLVVIPVVMPVVAPVVARVVARVVAAARRGR